MKILNCFQIQKEFHQFLNKRIKMILSRAKPAISSEKAEKEKSGSAKKQVPTIEQFLSKRDYTGKFITMYHLMKENRFPLKFISTIIEPLNVNYSSILLEH